MILIKRLLTILKANRFFGADKGDDSSRKLELVSEKLRMDIVKAKRQAVESITREKILVKELSQQKEAAHKWGLRAEDAVKSEQDALAKEALMEKENAIKRYGDLHRQYEALSASNDSLKKDLKRMELKEIELQDKVSALQTKIVTTKARTEARRVKSETSEMQRVLENVQDKIDIKEEYITVKEEIDQELNNADNVFRQFDEENAEAAMAEKLAKLKENIK